ncbi:MAG TPA: VWA domain-containing protein [Dehalococcoidia bacterium]|nr:VWA domain-containing protein [Dehalococcoidia bacterium]
MRRAYLIAALAAVVAFLGAVSVGAQAPGASLQIASISDAGYPNAQALVTLEQQGGGTAPALTPADVTVTLGGQPAKVQSAKLASSTENPLDVVIVIDTSGSMAGQPIALAKQAAKAFMTQLAPEDRVAVVRFSNDVQLAQDFTTDRAAAGAVIDGIEAQGNTALYRATAAAALKAGASTATRRAIVLLSDGADFGTDGATTRDQAVQAATTANVPIFAIGEGTDIDRAYLQQIADVSNGQYLEAPDPRQLGELYGGIARLLQSQYEITFDASGVQGTDAVPVAITIDAGGTKAMAQSTYKPVPAPAPTVAIDGLNDGGSVNAKTTLTAKVGGTAAVKVVTFSIDGSDVATLTKPPYAYIYDPAAFAGGHHEVTVHVDSAGGAAESKIAFSSAPPASPGGGSSMLLYATGAAAVLLLLGAGGGFWWLRRRSQRPTPVVTHVELVRARAPALPPPPADESDGDAGREVVEEAKGLLISRAGSDLGAEYVVGGSPVSIGSGEHCAVRVPDRGLSSVEARIWVRGKQLMVHRMTSLNALANEGVSGGWVILDPGDTFDLGPHEFEFRLLPVPAPVEESGDVPNVLREAPEPRQQAAPGGLSAAPAQASHLRLVELMPKNDVQQAPDSGGEERAS